MSDEREFTEGEVRDIFARAARKQHEAESVKRPRGLTLAELEEIGRTAGLDPVFVDAAAAEVLKPHRAPAADTFLGMPVELRRTRVLRAPLSDEVWRHVVADLQETFKTSGVITDVGGVREWRTHADARRNAVRVSVEPEGDGAQVTIGQTLWPQVLGVGLGAGMNAAMALVFFTLWLAGSGGDALLLPALVMGLFSIAFGAGSFVMTRRRGEEQLDRFDGLLDRTEARVREEAAQPEAASAAEPRLDLDAALGDEEASARASTTQRRTRS